MLLFKALEKERTMADSSVKEVNIIGQDESLALQLSTITLDLFPPLAQSESYRRAKENFIESKLNPIDIKEKKQLDHKLKLSYSEKELNIETPGSFSRESKLEAYRKELASQFHEATLLQESETSIMESYSQERFKGKPISLYTSWKHYFKSPDEKATEEKTFNAACREQFIATNREAVLLDVLLGAIKGELNNKEKIALLEKENKAQEILLPLYIKRINERKQEVMKIEADCKHARRYAPVAVAPKKDLTNDAPILVSMLNARQRLSEMMMTKVMTEAKPTKEENSLVLQLEQKRKQLVLSNPQRSEQASIANRNVIQGRQLDGYCREFRPLV